MRQSMVTLFVLFYSFSAYAQAQARGTGTPDPYFLNETNMPMGGTAGSSIPSRDVNSKTLSSNGQTLNTGVQNCVLIAAGQSNNANTAPSNFTPTHASALDNLNIYDGAIYKAADPLIGASFVNNAPPAGGHPTLRLADALVTAGKCVRVIIVPISIDTTTIAQWATGQFAGRLPTAILRIKQRGIVCGSANITCAILWGQGESDQLAGTTQTAYVAAFNTLVANAAAAGFVGRWFVAKETADPAGTVSAAVQAAQTANSPSGVINNAAGIYLGANADALTGNTCNGANACRQGDNIHWTDNGSQAYATDATNGWMQALHASGAPF